MTGSSSAIRKFVCFFAVIVGAAAPLAVPLSATPIATAPDVTDTFTPWTGDLVYDVSTAPGGGGVQDQWFTSTGSNVVTFTSSGGGMKLANSNLGNVTSAILNMSITPIWTEGTITYVGCSGSQDCGGPHPYSPGTLTLTPSTYTTVTAVSSTGTTHTWNIQVSSSDPLQLDLGYVNPGFLTDLSTGSAIDISWTQTIQLTGAYPNPTGQNKCHGCSLTFDVGSPSRTATVHASVDGTVSQVPEPSSGILLGLGLIAGTTILRRKFFPR